MLKYLYITVAVVCVFIVYAYFTADRQSDDARITGLITSVVQGANSRSLTQCMKYVSSDFSAESEINKDRLRLLVAQAFRSEPYFHMQADLKNLTIEGDQASAVVSVTINGWNSGGTIYKKDVNVKFKRENGRRLLVVPTPAWRVTYVDSFVVDDGEQVF